MINNQVTHRPMKRSLPPLKTIRVFESAARLLSFSKAAEELLVTHSAVSQQIKSLETFYGTNLFNRSHARVSLTSDGEKLLPVATDILDQLERVSAKLKKGNDDKNLRIHLTSAFAAHWLIPRFGSFQRQHPEITIHLLPSSVFSGFQSQEIDIAIRWGKPEDDNLETIKLFDVDAFAACAPDYLSSLVTPLLPQDLNPAHLIHDDDGAAWLALLNKANVKEIDISKGQYFADSSLALQSAVNGQGIITAGSILAAKELEAGRLIIPWDIFLPKRNAYYLSYPKFQQDSQAILLFSEWLKEEALAYEKNRTDLRSYLI